MTLAELYNAFKAELVKSGIETADLDARIMIETRLGYRWADIMAKPDIEVDDTDLKEDLRRRLAGEPISKIYGEAEFWGRPFKVTQDTLDPRPETELIVERALEIFKDVPPQKILDLGTGTGCLIVTLLLEFPTAHGVAVDISDSALAITKVNAERHGVTDRCVFLKSNWLEDVKANNEFDLVVSNPPYIPNPDIDSLGIAVKKYDPILALDGGADGLQAYKNIFSNLFRAFSPGGIGLFEFGKGQGDDVVRLAEESSLSVVGKYPDISGLMRVVEISCGDK